MRYFAAMFDYSHHHISAIPEFFFWGESKVCGIFPRGCSTHWAATNFVALGKSWVQREDNHSSDNVALENQPLELYKWKICLELPRSHPRYSGPAFCCGFFTHSLSLYLSIYLSIYLFIYLSLSLYIYIYRFIYLHIRIRQFFFGILLSVWGAQWPQVREPWVSCQVWPFPSVGCCSDPWFGRGVSWYRHRKWVY